MRARLPRRLVAVLQLSVLKGHAGRSAGRNGRAGRRGAACRLSTGGAHREECEPLARTMARARQRMYALRRETAAAPE